MSISSKPVEDIIKLNRIAQDAENFKAAQTFLSKGSIVDFSTTLINPIMNQDDSISASGTKVCMTRLIKTSEQPNMLPGTSESLKQEYSYESGFIAAIMQYALDQGVAINNTNYDTYK